MLTTLVFGAIGTLVETSELQRQAFNESFAEANLGWEWDAALYSDLLSVPGGHNRIQFFAQQQHMVLDTDQVGALHARKSAIYQRKLTDGTLQLRPGVARLMREALDNNVQLALASGTSGANIRAIAEAVGVDLPLEEFATVMDASSAARPKPSPDLYQQCLLTLGAQTSEAVAVEDTASSVGSAVAAGLVTVATPGSYVSNQNFSDAKAVLADLDSPHALRSAVPLPSAGASVAWLRELVDFHTA